METALRVLRVEDADDGTLGESIDADEMAPIFVEGPLRYP